ncbi:MAG: hypothetical protein ACRC50_07170, partial [Gaiella sp.]
MRELDAGRRRDREHRATHPAALEADVDEVRAGEVDRVPVAVTEADALQAGVSEAGEVDPALGEGDVDERRLSELRA